MDSSCYAGLTVQDYSMDLGVLKGETRSGAFRRINSGYVNHVVMPCDRCTTTLGSDDPAITAGCAACAALRGGPHFPVRHPIRTSQKSGEPPVCPSLRSFGVGGVTMALWATVLVMLLLMAGCAGERRRHVDGPVLAPRGGGTIGVPWESQFSSQSAVRFRDEVAVAAQLGWDEQGRVTGGIDVQTRQAYANVTKALETGGATLRDVVDETIFVTDMKAALNTVPAIRREIYGGNPIVASTMIEVKRLTDPNALIAIKVTAKLDVPLPRRGSGDGPSGGGRSHGGRRRGTGGGMGGWWGGGTGGGGPY